MTSITEPIIEVVNQISRSSLPTMHQRSSFFRSRVLNYIIDLDDSISGPRFSTGLMRWGEFEPQDI